MLGLANVPAEFDQLGLLIHGDATLSYDLGSNMMDIRFHNIVETAVPSRSLPDIVLDRTAVLSNGVYSYSRENDKWALRGRFYGTSSDPIKEAGGWFRHDRVEGVFGAVKQ